MDALSIASLAFGAMDQFGEYQSSMGAAEGLNAQAGMLDIQADVIVANAEFAARRAEESGRRDVGTYIARFAKSGVKFE